MLLGVLPYGRNVRHRLPEKGLELRSLGLERDELVEERNRSAPVPHLHVEPGVAGELLDALAATEVLPLGSGFLESAVLEPQPDPGVRRRQPELDGIDLVDELGVLGLMANLGPLRFQRVVGLAGLLEAGFFANSEEVALADHGKPVELRDDEVAAGLDDFQGLHGLDRLRSRGGRFLDVIGARLGHGPREKDEAAPEGHAPAELAPSDEVSDLGSLARDLKNGPLRVREFLERYSSRGGWSDTDAGAGGRQDGKNQLSVIDRPQPLEHERRNREPEGQSRCDRGVVGRVVVAVRARGSSEEGEHDPLHLDGDLPVHLLLGEAAKRDQRLAESTSVVVHLYDRPLEVLPRDDLVGEPALPDAILADVAGREPNRAVTEMDGLEARARDYLERTRAPLVRGAFQNSSQDDGGEGSYPVGASVSPEHGSKGYKDSRHSPVTWGEGFSRRSPGGNPLGEVLENLGLHGSQDNIRRCRRTSSA